MVKQRAIKFRAWDKENRQMLMNNELPAYLDSCNANEIFEVMRDEGLIVMQYTGIKDKSDKEVYEGDIVKIGNSHPGSFVPINTLGRLTVIEWKYSTFWINAKHLPNELGSQNRLDACEASIVGNIYENPELLK